MIDRRAVSQLTNDGDKDVKEAALSIVKSL